MLQSSSLSSCMHPKRLRSARLRVACNAGLRTGCFASDASLGRAPGSSRRVRFARLRFKRKVRGHSLSRAGGGLTSHSSRTRIVARHFGHLLGYHRLRKPPVAGRLNSGVRPLKSIRSSWRAAIVPLVVLHTFQAVSASASARPKKHGVALGLFRIGRLAGLRTWFVAARLVHSASVQAEGSRSLTLTGGWRPNQSFKPNPHRGSPLRSSSWLSSAPEATRGGSA